MFEITNINGRYADFVIARRSINCATVTREEFIEALIADAKDAIKSYNDNAIPVEKEFLNNCHAESVKKEREIIISKATAFANAKWKTEKKRNQYIEDAISEFDAKNAKFTPLISNLGFFDMDGNCGMSLYVNNNCILDESSFNYPERIGRCYDTLLNTNYFKKAIGWQFKYRGSSDSYTATFRPVIELLFDEETSKEIKKMQDLQGESVNRYYNY